MYRHSYAYFHLRFTSVPAPIETVFSRVTDRILRLIDLPPSRTIVKLNHQILERIEPISSRLKTSIFRLSRNDAVLPVQKAFSSLRYRAVGGLIGANVFGFMLLNSRFMKARSHIDGLPRADRHFLASRYNIGSGRIWCIPFSIFNHGDSLIQLGMNCFGLSLVGPAVEAAFGPGVLLGTFLFSGVVGALAEVAFGNHWCRGSSAGVTGLFGVGALASPAQVVSLWGVLDVRAASLAISIFGFETMAGLLASSRSEMAHLAHAAGVASAIPILYYLRWFMRRF